MPVSAYTNESHGRIASLILRHVALLVGFAGHSRQKHHCDSRILTHFPPTRDIISRAWDIFYLPTRLAVLPKEAMDSHCPDFGA
jgi:hypothetical protein